MNEIDHWISDPTSAYQQWQRTEAAGADRRAFSPRSIVQHEAMFERFMRHLAASKATLATFGADHLESFFADVDRRCQPGTTTRLRYQKLIDRLCRHLAEVGVREANPVAAFALQQAWPDDEPDPVYLPEDADARLQARIAAIDTDDARAIRNRAIVGLLLATGITAQETRLAKLGDVDLSASRPHIDIPKRGARAARRIPLAAFAVPAVARWRERQLDDADRLLFPSPRAPGPMNDATLGAIVRDELLAVDVRVSDMSPRTLRNTFARRLLISGKSNEEVSRLLGLASSRTVVRLRATISGEPLHAQT